MLRRMLLCFALILISTLAWGNETSPTREVWRVGNPIAYPPFSDVSASGEPEGFAVDLIRATTKDLNVELRFFSGTFDSLLVKLNAGEIDVLPFLAPTTEREEFVLFSDIHTEDFDAFFTRKSSPLIPHLSATRGKTIIVVRSDLAHLRLEHSSLAKEILAVATLPEAFALLASGKGDGVLANAAAGSITLERERVEQITRGPFIPDYTRQYAFGVGKDHKHIAERLERELSRIKATGEYARIYQKWIGYPDPTRSVRQYLWTGLGILLVGVLLMLAWTVSLRREVNRRTRELRENNVRLEREVATRVSVEAQLRAQEGQLEETIEARTRSLRETMAARELAERDLRRHLMAMEALWEMSKHQEKDPRFLFDYILEQIAQITDSRYAFYGTLNESETEMVIHAWSKDVMPECRMTDKPLSYQISACGLWAEAVRQRQAIVVNDYARSHPAKHGLPEGHVPLTRLISLPVIIDSRVVAVAAVANKSTDYTDADLRLLETFAANAQIITERQRLESERKAIEARLLETQKLESLGVLAGGIAHDFNNILTGILGTASLLAAQAPEGSNYARYAQTIESSSQRAADLVRQMLAYSGRGAFVVQHIALGRIVQESIDLIQASLSKQARLDVSLDKDLPMIEADASQIRQILMNLLVNASEALEEKPGQIEIRARALRLDGASAARLILNAGLNVGDECLHVEVKDTGCGIAPEMLRQIFEPFYTTKFFGRGLGLSAVFGILRQHRGGIAVTSERGKGTRFELFFHALKPTTERAPQEVPTPAPATQSRTVLVIDDEEIVRELAANTLSTFGVKTLLASDGDEGLAVFESHRASIDAVLLDLTMRGMQGDEVFSRLTQLEPSVRVIITSGWAEEEVLTRFHAEQPAGFLQKPFRPKDLMAKLFPEARPLKT